MGNPQYELLQQLTKAYAELMEKRKEGQTKYKDYYDQRHIAVEFDIGDEVLVLFDAPVKGPLVPRWEGPFEVIRN